jgi:3-oxoacyl-[acyl-carrier protein] reductase
MTAQNDLSDKVAIVTGASRGIGRAIALKLAANKARVIVNYAQNAEKAVEVVQLITRQGGEATAVQADVGRSADVKKLFDEAKATYGGVDILVNNAGTALLKLVAETSEEEFDSLFATNVKGTFLTCREAALHMRPQGRIINLSTSLTGMMLANYGVYCASKGAVEQLTHVLAKELGGRQITVNCISPGATETELFLAGKTQEMVQRSAQGAALGRLGKPEDIADVVAFLASDEARWVTGQNLRANGGTT